MSNACTVISINATSGDLIIDGDPNWDDQQLRIDGILVHAPYTSPKGQSVAASVQGWGNDEGNEMMMGIWYVGPNNNNENQNSFQMTIGQNAKGLMDVTENYPLAPMTIKYTIIAQTKWDLVLKFEDA